MTREIKFESKLPDDIDERVEKIQLRLEELNEEFCTMADELGDIGWDLEGDYKDLWESSNNALQSKKFKLESFTDLSNWLKNFRIDPHS
tara:strand:- start:1509 stop:1775 length:267 start_codon:yes stop_codon:yes gene_type:complete